MYDLDTWPDHTVRCIKYACGLTDECNTLVAGVWHVPQVYSVRRVSGRRISRYMGDFINNGYPGSKVFCRAIYPTKKPRNGVLSPAQVAENRHVSSNCVPLENYFGRMSGIWNVTGSKWKCSEKIYDSIFMLCMGLTNWHIR